MIDTDQLCRELLLAHRERMYRLGGRAPASWLVMLVAVIGGIVPIVLVMPFEGRHLLVTLDTGLPLSIALTFLCTRWWASPIQRLRAIFVALATAAVLCVARHWEIGFGEQLGLLWMFWHFGETFVWIVAVLIIASVARNVGPKLPAPAKYQPSTSNTLDRADHAPPPGEPAKLCIASPWFQRRSDQSAVGLVL